MKSILILAFSFQFTFLLNLLFCHLLGFDSSTGIQSSLQLILFLWWLSGPIAFTFPGDLQKLWYGDHHHEILLGEIFYSSSMCSCIFWLSSISYIKFIPIFIDLLTWSVIVLSNFLRGLWSFHSVVVSSFLSSVEETLSFFFGTPAQVLYSFFAFWHPLLPQYKISLFFCISLKTLTSEKKLKN